MRVVRAQRTVRLSGLRQSEASRPHRPGGLVVVTWWSLAHPAGRGAHPSADVEQGEACRRRRSLSTCPPDWARYCAWLQAGNPMSANSRRPGAVALGQLGPSDLDHRRCARRRDPASPGRECLPRGVVQVVVAPDNLGIPSRGHRPPGEIVGRMRPAQQDHSSRSRFWNRTWPSPGLDEGLASVGALSGPRRDGKAPRWAEVAPGRGTTRTSARALAGSAPAPRVRCRVRQPRLSISSTASRWRLRARPGRRRSSASGPALQPRNHCPAPRWIVPVGVFNPVRYFTRWAGYAS